MYADDILAMFNGEDDIESALEFLTEFKCTGLQFVVNSNDHSKTMLMKGDGDAKVDGRTLDSKPIPVGDQYKYLGAVVDFRNDRASIGTTHIKQKIKKAIDLVGAINAKTPVNSQGEAVRCIIAKTAVHSQLYGLGAIPLDQIGYGYNSFFSNLDKAIRKYARKRAYKISRNQIWHAIHNLLPTKWEAVKRRLRAIQLFQRRCTVAQEEWAKDELWTWIYDVNDKMLSNIEISTQIAQVLRYNKQKTNQLVWNWFKMETKEKLQETGRWDKYKNVPFGMKIHRDWRYYLTDHFPTAENKVTLKRGGAKCPRCGTDNPGITHIGIHCQQSELRKYAIDSGTYTEEELDKMDIYSLFHETEDAKKKRLMGVTGARLMKTAYWKYREECITTPECGLRLTRTTSGRTINGPPNLRS